MIRNETPFEQYNIPNIPSPARFLASELSTCAPESALFQVIPVPYEATVSYGQGTSQGPGAILAASDQLELWDGESVPADLGIYTWPAVDCQGAPLVVLERVAQAVTRALRAGRGDSTDNANKGKVPLPVLLGGEHTVTYGALKALQQHYGRFGVVQFDAHADLRDSYEGTPWNHGSVMRRAVKDLGLPLVQLGVRALCLEEVQARQTHKVTFHDATTLVRTPFEGLSALSLFPEDFPARIYITFDVDGLDPAVIPATGTPVPGGLGWYEALELTRLAMRGRQLLGFDVVELAPTSGFHASDFAAARLVYALMGLVQRNE